MAILYAVGAHGFGRQARTALPRASDLPKPSNPGHGEVFIVGVLAVALVKVGLPR